MYLIAAGSAVKHVFSEQVSQKYASNINLKERKN
jgi:hypothetical protein